MEKEKVLSGLAEVKRFLELNGMKRELREELKNPVMEERLAACFPRTYCPEDDFERNCLYQIFRKKLGEGR